MYELYKPENKIICPIKPQPFSSATDSSPLPAHSLLHPLAPRSTGTRPSCVDWASRWVRIEAIGSGFRTVLMACGEFRCCSRHRACGRRKRGSSMLIRSNRLSWACENIHLCTISRATLACGRLSLEQGSPRQTRWPRSLVDTGFLLELKLSTTQINCPLQCTHLDWSKDSPPRKRHSPFR